MGVRVNARGSHIVSVRNVVLASDCQVDVRRNSKRFVIEAKRTGGEAAPSPMELWYFHTLAWYFSLGARATKMPATSVRLRQIG